MADDDQGLGFRFYAGFAGIVVAIGIAIWVFVILISRAVYAWGLLGMFLVLAVVLMVFGWWVDRRDARRRSEIELGGG
jgi:hypothetical protein